MMKILILTLTLVALGTSFNLANQFAAAIVDSECPHDLEVLCIDDINKAYPICEKAAQEKGKDQTADINCLKYMLSIRKDCWPCICWVAQINKWTIKGCP